MSNSVTDFDRHYSDLNIKDKDDPKSLVNICPSVVAERIMSIPDEVFLLGESELRDKANAQASEEYVRIAFWEEYKRVERVGGKMNMNNVYASFVTKKYFYSYIVANSFKLAFMLQPPMEIQIALEELMLLGLKKQREIMTLPVVDAKGGVNVKLAAVQQKITEDVLNRRRGHVLRHTEITSKNLNVTLDANKPQAPQSIADIERQIKELENPALEHNPQQTFIEATCKDVSREKEKV